MARGDVPYEKNLTAASAFPKSFPRHYQLNDSPAVFIVAERRSPATVVVVAKMIVHGPSVMRIVIAYEDYAAGVQAVNMSQRLAGQFESEVEVDRELWSFKALSDPELLKKASVEATSAQMLVVAGKKVPRVVQEWIQGWAERRTDSPAAVVLLSEAEIQTQEDPESMEQLRRKLAKMDVDLFCAPPRGSEIRSFAPWGLDPDSQNDFELPPDFIVPHPEDRPQPRESL